MLIRTHDLCDTGAVLCQLSGCQANWELVNWEVMGSNPVEA